MIIRRARVSDIDDITALLSQVLEVHAKARPDLFVSGTVKYSKPELERIIPNDDTPVFVYAADNGKILGHAFTEITVNTHCNMPVGMKSMYIDDICVDESARRQNVGTKLYEHCIAYAENEGCYDVTLNVWEGNDSAKSFYESMGMKVRKTTMEKIIG